MSKELQELFDKVNTLLEAKIKTLEARLPTTGSNEQAETLNTYIESYY